MTSLRRSDNYIWSTSWALGTGATGTVYKGMHQEIGDSVAVKTFTVPRDMRQRPVELLKREFEVLQKLNHVNIVRMLAMEEELATKSKVLIMELCTGGSLYTILDDPQNSYGLEEGEFLCVLKDLAAGTKYLRDNNIIHRDLKPGNIMKFIKDDLKSIYKLIDFGAARELEENQQFMSLYGTEEYLHPDLYEKAVLKSPANKAFGASIDLWSIGVTLYHVATGSLPFRPYGGRRNKKTMHDITTKKSSGVISGVQHEENGVIEWGKELPKTCLLNQGLRELVTSLLAGILECQPNKMLSFDQFFKYTTDIVDRRAIHIFYVNEAKETTLYLQPNKKLADVKDQIFAQLKIEPSKQKLLLDKSVLDSVVDVSTIVANYPVTTPSQPLLLLHNEKTDVKGQPRSVTCFPTFHTSSVNVDHDSALARTCCNVAYAVKRHVERVFRCRNLLLKSPSILLSLITDEVTKLCSNMELLEQRSHDLDQRLSRLDKSCCVVSELIKNWPEQHECEPDLWKIMQIVSEVKQVKKQVNEKFQSLTKSLLILKHKVLDSCILQKEWDQDLKELNCPELTGCIEKADSYVNKIRESWQSLLKNKQIRDRTGRELSIHDQTFHKLEKVKIQQTTKKFVNLQQEQCVESCHRALQKLDEWYSGMHTTMVQCKCVEDILLSDESSVRTVVESYAADVNQAEEEVDNLMQQIITDLKNQNGLITETPSSTNGVISMASTNSNSSKRMLTEDFFTHLDKLSLSQKDLSEVICANSELLDNYISLVEQNQSLHSKFRECDYTEN